MLILFCMLLNRRVGRFSVIVMFWVRWLMSGWNWCRFCVVVLVMVNWFCIISLLWRWGVVRLWLLRCLCVGSIFGWGCCCLIVLLDLLRIMVWLCCWVVGCWIWFCGSLLCGVSIGWSCGLVLIWFFGNCNSLVVVKKFVMFCGFMFCFLMCWNLKLLSRLFVMRRFLNFFCCWFVRV